MSTRTAVKGLAHESEVGIRPESRATERGRGTSHSRRRSRGRFLAWSLCGVVWLPALIGAQESPLAKVIATVKPSVVFIFTTDAAGEPLSSGTGFVIDPNGFLITGYHVVEEASGITVVVRDQDKFSAEVVGVDEDHAGAPQNPRPAPASLIPGSPGGSARGRGTGMRTAGIIQSMGWIRGG